MDGYDATRAAVGLAEIPGETVLRVRGKDARRYLQRMLANEVANLKTGEGRRSLALDAKGHVVADLSVLCSGDDEFHLLCVPEARAGAAKLIAFYALADEVEVDDLTDELVVFSFQGPRAPEAASGLAPGPLALPRELDHVATKVGTIDARLVRHDRTGLGGVDVLVPVSGKDAARTLLEGAARSREGAALSLAALDLLRLEAGRARWGPDFGAETIPQEAQLETPAEGALSFDKGCFLGQETVARLRFRGHVNKKLVGFEVDGEPPAAGTALRKGDKEVGKITSALRSPRLGKTLALGYVRREHSEPGSEVEVASTPPVRARVASRPFA